MRIALCSITIECVLLHRWFFFVLLYTLPFPSSTHNTYIDFASVDECTENTLFGGAKVSTGFGTVEVACRAAWKARKTPGNFL